MPVRAPAWKDVFVIYPLQSFVDARLRADDLAENEFIGVSLRDVGKLRFSKVKINREKLVYLHAATFATKRDFNAHRLLHWAGLAGPAGGQHALKKAFLASYQGRAEAIESHEVMLAAVKEAGLDVAQAQTILTSDTYAQEVKDAEQYYMKAGIRSVPAIIINQKHLGTRSDRVNVEL